MQLYVPFPARVVGFFQQSLAFSAQVFAVIAKLHGSKVLLRREDEATCEDQTTEQQKRQP